MKTLASSHWRLSKKVQQSVQKQITYLTQGEYRDVTAGKHEHRVTVTKISYHLQDNSLQKLQVNTYIRNAHDNAFK